MARELNVYYDTRLAPVTFDFGSYLVIANAERQLLKLDSLSVHLHRPGFRNKTVREHAYDLGTKEWRFNHILLALTTILPTVSTVRWSKHNPSEIRFPSFPISYPPRSSAEHATSIPYLSNTLLRYKGKGLDLLPYQATDYSANLASSLARISDKERGRLVTISLRTSNQQTERNSNLRSWHEVYKRLSAAGFTVFVIPDFEDVLGERQFQQFDWNVFLPAVFDLSVRLGLFSTAIMNLGVLNGILVPLFHSTYPYLIFKPNVETINQTTTTWLRDIFGIEKGENFWWATREQRLSWEVDDSPQVIVDAFFQLLGGD